MLPSIRIIQCSARLVRPVRAISTSRVRFASEVPTRDPAGVFHKSDFTAQDPYPLAGRTDPGSDGSVPMSEDLTPHAPIDRSHENTETKRARLLWQSRKRGILETDLLLSTFAATHLETMDHETLVLYDSLLDEPDWEIYYYATNKKQPPSKFRDTPLMRALIQHVRNEEKETRSMPSLKDQSANYRADKATDAMRTKQGMKGDAEPEKGQREDGQKEELKEKIKGEDRDPSVIAS